MSESAPPPGGTAPTSAAAHDPFQVLAASAMAGVDHATGIATRVADGTYAPTDLTADVSECGKRAISMAMQIAQWWAKVLGIAPKGGDPLDTSHKVILQREGPSNFDERFVIDAAITTRPLTLRTAGCRRVGDGSAIVIPPELVVFTPAVVPTGVDEFRVSVRLSNVPAGVYEGTITAQETGDAEVSSKVMPAW